VTKYWVARSPWYLAALLWPLPKRCMTATRSTHPMRWDSSTAGSRRLAPRLDSLISGPLNSYAFAASFARHDCPLLGRKRSLVVAVGFWPRASHCEIAESGRSVALRLIRIVVMPGARLTERSPCRAPYRCVTSSIDAGRRQRRIVRRSPYCANSAFVRLRRHRRPSRTD
jgi:hypothetical protein